MVIRIADSVREFDYNGPFEQDALVPDDVLRNAYLATAERAGMWREKFVARTHLVSMTRMMCGESFGDVPLDWFRGRIPLCCKNPAGHGGGWGAAARPAKGRPSGWIGDDEPRDQAVKAAKAGEAWYATYLQSERWRRQRRRCLERDGHRCRICNSGHNLEAHHRSYKHCGHDRDEAAELFDLTTLCSVCHRHCHVVVGERVDTAQ